jgi:hypothetical protein
MALGGSVARDVLGEVSCSEREIYPLRRGLGSSSLQQSDKALAIITRGGFYENWLSVNITLQQSEQLAVELL